MCVLILGVCSLSGYISARLSKLYCCCLLLLESLNTDLFTLASWTRYKLHRPAFSRRYIQFFELLAQNPANPNLDGDLLKWLPLYFAVVS